MQNCQNTRTVAQTTQKEQNQPKEQKNFDRNPELISAYRAGDAAAGEALILQNRPLVFHIVKRFTDRGVDTEDLVEIGSIGLVKAINTFDPDRGCAFSTYAVPLIFGEIRRFLRDDGILKVSREEKRLCAVLNAERERRLAAGEDSGIAAVASAVGVSPEDAASAIFSGAPVRSLDEAAFGEEDDTTIGALVWDEEEETRNFDRLALRMAMEKLPEQERRLILLRYFRDFSQTEVAKILGVTQVKVSREEKKILAKLRAFME